MFFRKILSHSAEKFVGGPIRESVIAGVEKFYVSEGYVTIFRRNFFCLTAPKHFAEEPFCAVYQRVFGSEKNLDMREGQVSRCSFEKFLSHRVEKCVGALFSLSLVSGIEKVRIRELVDGRSVKIFRPNCFVSKCRKFS